MRVAGDSFQRIFTGILKHDIYRPSMIRNTQEIITYLTRTCKIKKGGGEAGKDKPLQEVHEVIQK